MKSMNWIKSYRFLSKIMKIKYKFKRNNWINFKSKKIKYLMKKIYYKKK